MSDMVDRQPRERAVRCWCGAKNIWSHSGLCPKHEVSVGQARGERARRGEADNASGTLVDGSKGLATGSSGETR